MWDYEPTEEAPDFLLRILDEYKLLNSRFFFLFFPVAWLWSEDVLKNPFLGLIKFWDPFLPSIRRSKRPPTFYIRR